MSISVLDQFEPNRILVVQHVADKHRIQAVVCDWRRHSNLADGAQSGAALFAVQQFLEAESENT